MNSIHGVSTKILEADGDEINPSTQEKQEELIIASGGDAVNKAIESLTTNLSASAFDTSTVHATVYTFAGLFLKFSTAQVKTITLSLTNGSVDFPLWKKENDSAQDRVFVPEKDWRLPADWELKLEITQTSGSCIADILLLTTS